MLPPIPPSLVPSLRVRLEWPSNCCPISPDSPPTFPHTGISPLFNPLLASSQRTQNTKSLLFPMTEITGITPKPKVFSLSISRLNPEKVRLLLWWWGSGLWRDVLLIPRCYKWDYCNLADHPSPTGGEPQNFSHGWVTHQAD